VSVLQQHLQQTPSLRRDLSERARARTSQSGEEEGRERREDKLVGRGLDSKNGREADGEEFEEERGAVAMDLLHTGDRVEDHLRERQEEEGEEETSSKVRERRGRR
jgi:hypothetical protein